MYFIENYRKSDQRKTSEMKFNPFLKSNGATE